MTRSGRARYRRRLRQKDPRKWEPTGYIPKPPPKKPQRLQHVAHKVRMHKPLIGYKQGLHVKMSKILYKNTPRQKQKELKAELVRSYAGRNSEGRKNIRARYREKQAQKHQALRLQKELANVPQP